MTVLETTRPYTRPGVYVGQLQRPRVGASTTFRRTPLFIGRGTPNLLHTDKPVVRGYIEETVLAFTKVTPFRAMLPYYASGAKDTARLVLGDGSELDQRQWKFIQDENGRYFSVEVSATVYDETKTYILSYQSADPRAYDDTGIADIENVLQIGLRADSNDFLPSDYLLETQIGKFAEGSSIMGVERNTGTGDLPQIHGSSTYQGPTRNFHFAVEDVKTLALPTVVSSVPTPASATALPKMDVSNWTGEQDAIYNLKLESKSADSNLLTFSWTRNNPTGSGTLEVRLGFEGSVAFTDGLVLDFGDMTAYKLGDSFAFTVGLREGTQVYMSWFSEDANGGGGDFVVNAHNRTKLSWNVGIALIFGADLSKYKAGDAYNLTVTSTGRIIWRYDLEGSENISVDDLNFDQTGTITGTRRAYYIALSEVNTQSVRSIELLNELGKVSTTLTGSDFRHIEGTGYVVLQQHPEEAVKAMRVNYLYSNAPGYGQVYYIDAEAKKPASAYNKVLFLTSDDYHRFAGYPTPENHLGIMADIAFELIKLDQIAIIQVEDSDRDGKYSNADYSNAIAVMSETTKISDVTVLGNIGSLGNLLFEINRRNDPFERAECLAWVGYPANTPIGTSQLLEGTLTYYGGVVMQVGASSNAHGCHISVANTWAKRTITQYNGQQRSVTLDGSFLAGTLACMTAAFNMPYESLLRRGVPGFDEIQNFTDGELRSVGPYGFAILEQTGEVIKVMDIVTHDNFAPDSRQVNAMTQKHYMNNVVREQLDLALIGMVPESKEDGELLVRSTLVSILADMVSKGYLGKYQDDAGNSRQIDANKDVKVQRSDTDPTKYYVSWGAYLKYHIARIHGLYVIDTNKLAM